MVALFLVRGVLAADQGTASMKDIAKAVQEGAEAFLARAAATNLGPKRWWHTKIHERRNSTTALKSD